jgi:hypothetical protein
MTNDLTTLETEPKVFRHAYSEMLDSYCPYQNFGFFRETNRHITRLDVGFYEEISFITSVSFRS